MRVLAALVGSLLLGAPLSAPPTPAVVLSGLTATPGQVRFLLTARDLPPGTAVDPAAVAVSIEGTPLRAKVAPATDTTGLPPRLLVVVVDTSASTSSAFRAAAKAAATGLAASLPADVQLGLYGTGTAAPLAPTTDRAAFTDAVAGLAFGGNADPVNGVEAARRAIAATSGERRLLLFSDGREVFAGPRNGQVGGSVTATGLGLDVVTMGAAGSGLASLTELANGAGGRVLAGTDAASVTAQWQEVGRHFPPPLAVTATVPNHWGGATALVQVDVAGIGSATITATFAAAPSGAAAPSTPPLSWVPDWLRYVVALLVFAAVILVMLALVWPRSEAHERIKQIAHFRPGRSVPAAAPEPVQPGSAGGRLARTALAASATVVRTANWEDRIALRLDRAGMKWRPHEWLLIRTLITIAVGILFGLVGGWIAGLVGLLIGFAGTVVYQMVLIDRRSRGFAEQLPDALQLVIGSLRSGFSLSQALDSLVREAPQPVGAEIGRAVAEHKLGGDLADGLDRVAQRTRSEDLSWVVMAVRIQRDVGGNLAEILQTSVDTMRERARLRRHVRSLSAEGRLSAWVLICVPLVLGTFMTIYRRSYIMPLFTDPRGLVMLFGGGVLFVIGIIWMIRVIRVEA